MGVIRVKHTSIIIPDYNIGDDVELERSLSIWDEVNFKSIDKGFMYKKETRELIVPRGISIKYLEKKFNMLSVVDMEPDPHLAAVYKLKVEPRADVQRRGIAFLLGEGEFSYTKKYSQLSLNFDTGYGKTYTAIATLTILKTRAIIITNQNSLKDQWIKEFLDKTYIGENFLYNIEGRPAITKLLKSDMNYKVFFVNHQTLNSYAKSNGWDAVGELFKKMKVGVKIFDEAHLQFDNMMRIDFSTNTKRTFYLTANFERSSYKDDKLFSTCFNNVVQYGIEEKASARKHIKYLAVFFDSKPEGMERLYIKNRFGLDRNRYIEYQLEKKKLFNVIDFIMEKISTDKTLVLFSTIEATELYYEHIKRIYPDKIFSLVNSTAPQELRDNVHVADIIVSTPKSLGVGIDIKGLRFIINTEPYSSKITANQVPGRLRPISATEDSGYIEIVDNGFPIVVQSYKKRLRYIREKCSSTKIFDYKDGM
jgi:superfamily II DNA or RNA helicase